MNQVSHELKTPLTNIRLSTELRTSADTVRSLPEKFNAIVGLARGETLVVWEDDDIYLPHLISSHVAAMEGHIWSKPSKVVSDYTDRRKKSATYDLDWGDFVVIQFAFMETTDQGRSSTIELRVRATEAVSRGLPLESDAVSCAHGARIWSVCHSHARGNPANGGDLE